MKIKYLLYTTIVTIRSLLLIEKKTFSKLFFWCTEMHNRKMANYYKAEVVYDKIAKCK